MRKMPRLIRSVLAILAVCLLLGVMWRYYIQRTHLLQEIQANLEVSAQQQTAVIREFRKLWLDNVNVALMLQYVSPLLEKWMQNPPDTAEIQSLIATLRSTQAQYQFRDALFIKPSGQLYFRLNAQAGDLTERSRQAIAEAFRTKKALLTDIYREPDSGSLLIDQVVPSFIGSGDSAHPSGAVIYQYSAEPLLIPGPQASPSPLRSAETVIIRRDGDSMLYLNNLLHSMDAALNLRIPLDRKDVITVKAVTGQRGLLEGTDYRGVRTFAFVLPVPGTDWLVLSKADKSEALAPLRMELYILLAVLFLISISLAGIIVFLRHLKNNSLPDTGRDSNAENLREKVQYETILDGITQGCQIIDFEWRYIFINSVAARNRGHTKKELMSHTVMELFPEFMADKNVSGSFTKCMEERRPQYFEAELDTPEGIKGWYSFSIQPVPEGIFVLTTDIGDRKKAEEENLRLVAAIEQSSELVMIFDAEGIISYVNPAYEAVTGYKKEEVLGKRPPLILKGKQDKQTYEDLWNTIHGGKPWHGRYVDQKKDGTYYTEDATIWPIKDASGTISSFVAVKRDISEYQKLEKEKEKLQSQLLQSQKMESVGRLAGGVAHDFNNMLSVILGHAQLSLETLEPTHPLLNTLQEINKAALRSADLTNQLLAFARKQTVSPQVLNLNETIGGLLKMLQRLIHEGIHLAWMPGYDLWSVKIDPSQVDQILANLAVNARDAIETTGRISIETGNVSFDEDSRNSHPDCTPGEYVMLAISDDGCGMKPDTIEHIFEPFFTTKNIGKGTGLGLSTVYGIVKQNGGFINIYSEPDRGTIFKIYLPRHEGEENNAAKEQHRESPKGEGETILLVEDETAVKDLTTLMLKRQGYKVIASTSPNEAIHLAQDYTDNIHLMIVDVVMPEMTGRELADTLLHLRPGLRLLFMSGYTADVIAHHGILDGNIHFIQKPFSSKSLAFKVREALEA